MSDRSKADLYAVALLGGLSAWIIVGALALGIGTPQRMGSGFFPLVVACLLLLVTVSIAVSAWRASGRAPAVALRSALFIFAGLVAFALVLPVFGLVPAVAALIVVSSAAMPGARWSRIALLVLFVVALSWAIFVTGVGVPVPAFSWG